MSAVSETLPAKQTTIAALKPQPEQAVQNLPVVRSGFDTLQAFELMQRGAKLLASSTLVPKDYQGNLPNCVIALNMAQRIGADPLLVMQNLYVVHGRPGWSAQFLIACFNQCGRFTAIRYRWTATQADGDAWGCQAYAKELSTGEIIEGPHITIALAKKEGWYQKSGSKWQTIPQLMLMYRAAAWLVRTHAPEISMGLQTTEELGDVYDASRRRDGSYAVTLDTLREGAEVELAGGGTVDVVDTSTGEVIEGQAAEATDASEKKSADPTAFGIDLEKVEKDLRAAKTTGALAAIWIKVQAFAAAGGEIPLPVEAAYDEMRESLANKGK